MYHDDGQNKSDCFTLVSARKRIIRYKIASGLGNVAYRPRLPCSFFVSIVTFSKKKIVSVVNVVGITSGYDVLMNSYGIMAVYLLRINHFRFLIYFLR